MDTIKKMRDLELDKAIAVEVMKWEFAIHKKYMISWWTPTKNMLQAWEVVVHMTDKGYCPALVFDDNGHWALSFEGMMSCSWNDVDDVSLSAFVKANMWCSSATRAICESSLYNFRKYG